MADSMAAETVMSSATKKNGRVILHTLHTEAD